MIWIAFAVTVLVAATTAGWWWRSTRFDRFFKRTQRELKALGYDLVWAPKKAQEHLVTEAIAIWTAAPKFNPRRLAMMMFVFYCTKFVPFSDRPLKKGMSGAIPVMLKWKAQDVALAQQADEAITTLVTFLSEGFEKSGMDRLKILEAQTNLYHLAAGSPDIDIRAVVDQAIIDALEDDGGSNR